jgi:ATP-binding cassette subfamily B protein
MIRDLFDYIGKKGRLTMLGAVLSETGNALIYAAVMLTVFDMLYAVLADPGASLLPHIVRFAWLLAGKFICTTVSMITMHDAGFELETALKARIVRRLKRFSLGFYTNEQLGNISTVVHDDIESLRQNTSYMGVSMAADTITALVIGTALFALNREYGTVSGGLRPRQKEATEIRRGCFDAAANHKRDKRRRLSRDFNQTVQYKILEENQT